MGGSNEPSNIIELTVPEHAEAHRILFEKHGKWQDELAWKGLSGRLSKEEAIREKLRLANIGNKNAAGDRHRGGNPKGYKPSAETIEKLRRSHIGNKSGAGNLGRKNTKPRKDIGCICITDEIATKYVPKDVPIPNGWRRGRHTTKRT